MSTPSPVSHMGSAHFIRMEWVRSQAQPSHWICKPGSLTANYVSRGKVRENPKRGGRNMATRYKRSPTTYFGSPLADTVASGASPSFSAKKRNKSVQNRPLQDVSFAVEQTGLIRKESRRDGP